jgi:hyaluronan synthase
MPGCLAILFLCISLLVSNVLRHVLAILIRINPRALTKDFQYQPTVSIILPCFNEGRTVYETIESISHSHYPKDKFEIVACDDCSIDDSYDWLLRAQKDFTAIRMCVLRNRENRGKAHTVFTALHKSNAEIILSIDSDCIFAPNAIQELVSCFADPKIGAVGGVVGVRNVNDNVLTACQTFVYYICFQFLKSVETLTKTVTCISGCMFAVRGELMRKLEPAVLNRRWFGIPVNDGEDRFLTHMILLEGYGTVINTEAQCWTTVPNNMKTLFKQQIRWQRSGVRDFFLTLRTLPQHVTKLPPNALFSQIIPTLAALASISIVLLIKEGPILLTIAPAVVLFYGTLVALFHLCTSLRNPEQRVRNPLSLLVFAVWIFAGRLIEILAVFTLDSRDWGTRATKADPPPVSTVNPKRSPPVRQPAHALAMNSRRTPVRPAPISPVLIPSVPRSHS